MKVVLPVSPKVEPHEFSPRDFIGGDAALDFLNTVTGRDQSPRDWLDSYPRLLEWAALTELLPEKLVRALSRRAHGEAAMAARALTRAREFREQLFHLVTGLLSGKQPAQEALASLREHWVAGTAAHELRFRDGRLSAGLRDDARDFNLVTSLVAYRMVEYVLPLPTQRLRICEGPNCSWLFIDSSKAGRRRWCDMAVCGNAAKSRRFHARSSRRRHD